MASVYAAISDSFGRKLVLMVCILGSLALYVSLVVASATNNTTFLLLGGFVHGSTLSTHAVSTAMISDLTSKSERVGFISNLVAINAAGRAVAQIVGWCILKQFFTSYKKVWGVLLGFSILVMIFAATFIKETLPDERAPFSLSAVNPIRGFRLLKNRFLLIFAFMITFFLLGLVGVLICLGPYIMAVHAFTQADAVFPALLMNVVTALFLPISVAVSTPDRLGPAITLALGILLCFAGTLVLAFFSPFHIAAVWVAVCILGAGFGMAAPAGNALLTCLVANTEQARLQGIMAVFALFGLGLGAPLFAKGLFNAAAVDFAAGVPFVVAALFDFVSLLLLGFALWKYPDYKHKFSDDPDIGDSEVALHKVDNWVDSDTMELAMITSETLI